MATFDPFDKKAASVQAARDREAAEQKRKLQVGEEMRRKKQLLQSDVAKLQQEITRRKQETVSLTQDLERGTQIVSQKKKDISDIERELQLLERKLPEEDKKVKFFSQILSTISAKVLSLRNKYLEVSGDEKKLTESTQSKKGALAIAIQKKDLLSSESERLNASITRVKNEVDREKKDLVQRQTGVLKVEREQQLLEQSIESTQQKIHEIEQRLQTTREIASKQLQEKKGIDSEISKEDLGAHGLLQSTQAKDNELQRLTQEYDKVHRELEQQKSIVEKIESGLYQGQDSEKQEERTLSEIRKEENELLSEEKKKISEIEIVKSEVSKLQQEVVRKKQEVTVLRQEIDRITRLLEQKKRESAEVEKQLEILEHKIPEEGRKVDSISKILELITSKLQSLRAKQADVSGKEKKDEEAVQVKKTLLVAATQKRNQLTAESDRLSAAIVKVKSEVDREKKGLVQKQTEILKIEHQQEVLEQSAQAATQKVHELERELQSLRDIASKYAQEKMRTDSGYNQESQGVQVLLQATQAKDSELYRLTQEYDRVRREFIQQKDIVERNQAALAQDEGGKEKDEAALAEVKHEEEQLLNDEKKKVVDMNAAKFEFEKDINNKKLLEAKKIDTFSHITNESEVLHQKELRKSVVENELKKFEMELQQKERELQGIHV